MADKVIMAKRDPLPEQFNSLEDAAEFWNTHSVADYEDLMEDVNVDIELMDRSVYYCAVAKDLFSQIHEVAQKQGISTQTLINLWLQEKLIQVA